MPDLSALDVLVLHTIAHRARAKRVADICLVLNIEDTHLVTYSLKKLDAHKLLTSGRRGSEKTVSLTAKGDEIVQRYRKIRERCWCSRSRAPAPTSAACRKSPA